MSHIILNSFKFNLLDSPKTPETVEELRKDRIDEERFGQDSCTTNDDDRGGTGIRDPRTEKLIWFGLSDPILLVRSMNP